MITLVSSFFILLENENLNKEDDDDSNFFNKLCPYLKYLFLKNIAIYSYYFMK